jgi:hypothetical protein
MLVSVGLEGEFGGSFLGDVADLRLLQVSNETSNTRKI